MPTLIENATDLWDRLQAIPKRLGVPNYKDVTVVRTEGNYEVTPTPIVVSAAGPGTSVPGGSQLGIPGTLAINGVTQRTEAVIVTMSRNNPRDTIFSDQVKYYLIEGQRYQPLTLGENNNLTWEIMAQRKYDRR